MKSFKQYIKEEPVVIANIHGSHARKKKEEPVVIANTHGSHARKKLKESNNSWDEYASKNHNPHLDSNLKTAMKQLNDTHPLNPESHNHLRKYTSSSTELSDHFLRSDSKNVNPIPKDNSKVWGHDIKALDNSITSHKLNHDLNTFSGIGFNPEKLSKNKVVTHFSSSIDPNEAKEFSQPDVKIHKTKAVYHIIKHHLKKGTPAAVIGSHLHYKDDSPISEFHHEKEVLLPRTDATPEKYHMKFHGYKDYDHDDGIIRVHDVTWHPTK